MIIASHQLIGHPDRAARITSVLLSALLLQTIAPLEAQAENPEVTRWEERINATRKAIRNTTKHEHLDMSPREHAEGSKGVKCRAENAFVALGTDVKHFDRNSGKEC